MGANMLNLFPNSLRQCNGLSRRSFMQVGSLAVGGLTLPNLLRHEALAKDGGSKPRRKSVILIWAAGGPSHIDMYDLKQIGRAHV